MCLNDSYGLASVILAFILFFSCVLVGIFLIQAQIVFGFEVLTRGKTLVKLIYHMAPQSLTTVSSLFI